MNRMKILSLVWRANDVPVDERLPERCLVGWTEIACSLGVVIRHAKDLLYSTAIAPPYSQEKSCNFTYVAMPPDRMAVFRGPIEDKEKNWGSLGAAEPLICTPDYREMWSKHGGPYFMRVVDVARRFSRGSHARLDIFDGDMLIEEITKATLIPVCWNKLSLARWNDFRKWTLPIKRSAAGQGKSLDTFLRIKSPDLSERGALKYVCGRVNHSPKTGDYS